MGTRFLVVVYSGPIQPLKRHMRTKLIIDETLEHLDSGTRLAVPEVQRSETVGASGREPGGEEMLVSPYPTPGINVVGTVGSVEITGKAFGPVKVRLSCAAI